MLYNGDRKMQKKIKYTITMFLILLISCFSCKENSSDSVSAKNENAAVRWEKMSAGIQNTGSVKKPVLMFFYTEWCIYCKKMDSEVFSDPEISQYLNENFVSMRVNPEKESGSIEIMGEKVTPSKLMAYAGANGFPTTLFLDDEKKPVTTIPGFVEKKAFLSILKYLKEECYQDKISLGDYIKNPEICRAKKI